MQKAKTCKYCGKEYVKVRRTQVVCGSAECKKRLKYESNAQWKKSLPPEEARRKEEDRQKNRRNTGERRWAKRRARIIALVDKETRRYRGTK